MGIGAKSGGFRASLVTAAVLTGFILLGVLATLPVYRRPEPSVPSVLLPRSLRPLYGDGRNDYGGLYSGVPCERDCNSHYFNGLPTDGMSG